MSSTKQTQKKPHEPKDNWVCVGSLGAPHGVKGDIKVRSFTEDKDSLAKFDELYLGDEHACVKLVYKFSNKDGFVARVGGIDTREQAIEAKGKQFFIKREQLPETSGDDFYIADLIGLKAINPTGERIGIIKAVLNFGAGDVLELTLTQTRKTIGREPMIPFKKQFVPEVEIEKGFVVVDLEVWLETLRESLAKGEG